jgi:hypothetical protein
MISLTQVQEYCQNKSILLIGNGPVGQLPERDLTIRMNYGIKGGDCDIWVCNLLQSEQKVMSVSRNQKFILRLNAERDAFRIKKSYPNALHPITYFWNAEEFNEMATELDYDRPLTGTISIYWLLKYTELKSLTITGFNHFETNNIHADTGLVKPHKIEKDKDYINKLIEQGKVEWIKT